MVDDGESHRPIAPWSPYRHAGCGSSYRREKLLEGLRAGLAFGTACHKAGINESTGRGWVRRGRQDLSGPYHALALEVDAAIAEAEARRRADPELPEEIVVQLCWADDLELTFYDDGGRPY